jgi:hypothetical protein
MFNLVTFLAGFNIFNGEKLAKLIFYGILIAAGIGIYHKTFIAPTYKTIKTTQIVRPKEVTIYEDNDNRKDKFIGLQVWKLRAGITLAE